MANPVLSDRANQDRVTILTLRAEREALLRRAEAGAKAKGGAL